MVQVNTHDEFLDYEIAAWGEDYIFTLLDKGYVVVQVHDDNGTSHFTWQMPLTQPAKSATIRSGSSAVLLPFDRASRL